MPIRVILLLTLAALTGCANLGTTTLEYSNPITGANLTVKIPKEVEAKELYWYIDAESGLAWMWSKEWKTVNVETIKAQGEAQSKLIQEISKGAAEGAVKGLKASSGIP